MAKFRKKPVVVEASSWFRNGDHPEDDVRMVSIEGSDPFPSEGKIVRYYRHPGVSGDSPCVRSIPCGKTMHNHGWIDTPEGGHTVCPGDWIVTGVQGERYPVKDAIFTATYDPVPDVVADAHYEH